MSTDLTTSPDADDLRALARSAPWRFTTLHWRHRSWDFQRPTEEQPAVEAWLERPWALRLRRGDETWTESGPPYSSSVWDSRPMTPPTAVDPVRRDDGLVLERPSSFDVDYDDPMTGSFTWVAMLDPVELSAGVDFSAVREEPRLGRRTWWAEAVPTPDYEARCAGCCDLLPTAVAWETEADRQGWDDAQSARPNLPFLPTRYLVGLDVQTGIVVDVTPLDGTMGLKLSNEIHEVDAAFDHEG